MDQAEPAVGPIGDELGVGGDRLDELAVLERQVAEQFEGVVPPGAAKRLVDHPPEQERAVAGLAPPGETSARPGGRRPWLGRSPGPRAGAPRSAAGTRGGRSPRAGIRLLDRAPGLERDLDDLVAELLDHALIDLDRLGIIA